MYNLWQRGSTGSTPEGETYGQTFDANGKPTTFDDAVQIIANEINNPTSSIRLGERNFDVWFSFPAGAASIEIGVGLIF